MKKFYISFGQIHAHSVNGKTYDKDCIGVIMAKDYDEARKKAFEIFGQKWSMLYKEVPNMSFFPRGFLQL